MNTRQPTVAIALLMLAAGMVNSGAVSQEPSEAELQQLEEAHNDAVTDPKQEVVCRKEAQVGTRIKRTVCRTKAMMEVESKDAERFAEKPRPVPTRE